jgi:hypothetical protein
MDAIETARRKLLDKGFTLARSGNHADHRTILTELQRSPDYPLARLNLESPGVLRQLDMLCAEARKRAKFDAKRAERVFEA